MGDSDLAEIISELTAKINKIEDKKEIHHKYEKEIIEDLKNLDIHNMSPINALNKLFELQKKIKNWE